MSESALSALYKGLQTHLSGAGGIWGNQVYANVAPSEISRPYVVYAVVGGGEENALRHADALLTVSVKCVADSLYDAMLGADKISALLNDKGEQEVTSGGLGGGVDWIVHTVTQGRVIQIVEEFMSQDIFHSGFQFQIRMESK